jgi:hypothetical protein
VKKEKIGKMGTLERERRERGSKIEIGSKREKERKNE